jgi:hypothetical protein
MILLYFGVLGKLIVAELPKNLVPKFIPRISESHHWTLPWATYSQSVRSQTLSYILELLYQNLPLSPLQIFRIKLLVFTHFLVFFLAFYFQPTHHPPRCDFPNNIWWKAQKLEAHNAIFYSLLLFSVSLLDTFSSTPYSQSPKYTFPPC